MSYLSGGSGSPFSFLTIFTMVVAIAFLVIGVVGILRYQNPPASPDPPETQSEKNIRLASFYGSILVVVLNSFGLLFLLVQMFISMSRQQKQQERFDCSSVCSAPSPKTLACNPSLSLARDGRHPCGYLSEMYFPDSVDVFSRAKPSGCSRPATTSCPCVAAWDKWSR